MIMKTGSYLFLSGCLCVGLLAGCGKEDEEPDHKIVKGRVSDVNKATGEVGMLWYNEKRGETMSLKGKLAQGAEILINGRTASLDDVLIDDEVEVVGSVVGEGESRRLIAHRVTIIRVEDMRGDESALDEDDAANGEDQEESPAAGGVEP